MRAMQKTRPLTRSGASDSRYERVNHHIKECSFACSDVSSGVTVCLISLCEFYSPWGRRNTLRDLAIFGPISTVPEQIEADLKGVLHNKMMDSTPAQAAIRCNRAEYDNIRVV